MCSKIMIVDDNVQWLDKTCHHIGTLGYETYCYNTAKQALAEFSNVKPFLVFADLQLTNHIDGATMATKMHMIDPLCIFVVISGLIKTWDIGFLLGSVFTDVIAKPVKCDILDRIIADAVDKRTRWNEILGMSFNG